MLIIMAVVAVVAAVLGPIVRSIDPQERMPLLATWGVWLAASIAWVGYLTHQRRQAERLVGGARLKLPLYDENVPQASSVRRWFNVVMALFFALCFVSMLSGEVSSFLRGSPRSSSIVSHTIFATMCVWWTARSITSIWWRNNVRFGERGILWDRRALLWDHIVSWIWDARRTDILDIRGVDQFNRDMDVRVRVPESLRNEVESLVQSRVVPNSAVDIQMPGNMLARVPLSVAIRDPRFLKTIGFILLVFLGMILSGYLFSTGFTGIREFDETIWFGFIGFAIARARWRASRAALAGVPIVRLRSSRKWGLATMFLVAMGATYWIGITFGGTSETIAYAGGLGFGALASVAVSYLWKMPFDLRANGVYAAGKLWRWNEVQVMKWDAVSGKLSLSRGMSQIASKVPVEQRELIDTVLREKTSSVVGHVK